MADVVTLMGREFSILRHPSRVRVTVGIDEFGGYFIKCPSRCSAEDVKKLLSGDIESLLNKLNEKSGKMPRTHMYEDGEVFLYKGKGYPLKRAGTNDGSSLRLSNGTFVMPESEAGKEFHAFEKWYKRALYSELRLILPEWTRTLRVSPAAVNIKSVRTLWGSCSAKGSLTFCTRLALVPFDLLEYTVVHELCHLLHMDHSRAFWDEVAKHIPDFKKRRALLRESAHIYRWW